jgi:hypothetical protein
MASRNSERLKRDEEELELMLKQHQPEDENPEGDPETLKVDDEKLSKEEESYKKRYGDLRRHMQKKEEEWEARIKELEGKGKSTVAPPKSDEDLEQWIEANPDVAGIVALLAKRQAEELMGDTKTEVEELSKLRRETTKERKEQEIVKSHPDFLKLREADDFHDWVEEQPKWIQDSVYDEDAEPKAIIRALDLYKMDRKLTKADKKKEDRDAVALIKTPRKAAVDEDGDGETFSESQVDKMSMKEYAEKQDAIANAMRTGKFIYDKSGGAR